MNLESKRYFGKLNLKIGKMVLNDKRKNILDFWTLCEIADFERFKLKGSGVVSHSLGGVQTKALTNEYTKNGNYTDVDYKKNDIYRLYIGIIKSDEAIRYIYEKLKSRNLIPDESLEKSVRDIEQLPSFSDYTYMAYIYVDANNNLISLSGKSIIINPLFYILKNLLDKNLVNTIAYNEFTENVCKEFSNRYNIIENTNAIIIPDLEYLLNKLKSPHMLKILSDIENCEVYILEQLQKEIEVIANNKDDENQTKAQGYQKFFEKEKTKENSKFILQPSLKRPLTYLEVAKKVAKKRFYHYVYLLTGAKYDQSEIPKNLFIVDFINKNKKVTPALAYNPQKDDSEITEKKLEAIFNDCCKQLYLMEEDNKNSANIFYKENNQSLSIFQKAFLNKTSKEIEEIEESKFLSFYINALDEDPINLTLPYLDNVTEKIDINSSIEIRKEYNSFEYFKTIKARWPANYPLNYAQQMAVNHFFSKFNQPNNIFSVNGPPGTGKTTLLKDIVAEITRRKIEHCIALDGNIFDKDDGLFKSELCGIYEIIVVSNNNTAVENITKELPKLDNIDLAYINYQQEDFLLSSFTNDFYGFNGWSLIAINLGKGEKFDKFKERFEAFKEAVKESDILNIASLKRRKILLFEKYNKCKKSIITIENTLQELHNIDTLRAEKKQLLNEYQNLKKDITQLQENKKIIAIKLNKLNGEKKSLEESINRMREILSLGEYEKKEFGFFKKIFRYNAFKEVKLKISQNRKTLSVLLMNIENIKKSFIEKNSLREEIQEDINDKAEQYEKVKCFYHETVSKLDEIENIENERTYHINNDTFYELSEEELQKSSLYAEEEYMKEKAQLFVLSIQIQEVLFLTHFDRFSESIESYLINYKKPLSSDDINKLRRNFSALSFVLPVVSTSLASSYQMFKNIDRYGTLLCDEAGQATPQSLVGLFNRASNALIVGDPLQVEPVFTAPKILVDLIQDMYEIEDIYSPSKSSVQRLADEANTMGAYYGNDEDKLWVGMPLVVHRRCIEPMFSISNKISYDEKMVLATSLINNEDKINQLPKSCWIDVKSEEKDFIGNTSRKENEKLKSFIQKYQEILDNNYYIISPFKSIYDLKDDFKSVSLGTVHTFQGKEQDVVFVVLGGNVSRVGAKGWVSSKPNILNVATTRAKKRIYFIGDYDLWKGHKYFRTVVELLNKCN